MDEPFLAEIRFAPVRFLPEGWAWCDGREMSIAQYPALFELLGTTYGGDGRSTFALPNLLGRKPVQIELHSVNLTLFSQAANPFSLAGVNPSHYNLQPYQATYFCIALQGVFPVISKGG